MIDMLATEPHFVDHLAPVWLALPEAVRGLFYVPGELGEHAMRRGVSPAHDFPGDAPVLAASYGDEKRARKMGRRQIAFMEHGAGQSYGGDHRGADSGSYAGGRDRNDVSLFLVPNEHAAARFRKAYPRARVEIVGCPKLDQLPRRQISPLEQEPVVAVSFHCDFAVCPETRSAYGHYQGVLPALIKRYKVLGHGHPRALQHISGVSPMSPRLDRLWRRLGVEIAEDFEDVCRRADLYICDNSSTLFEFASTGRPVLVLNAPGYRRTVNHGLRFWEAANVGIQVDEPEALLPAVERALADGPAEQANREAALRIVYAHRTGAAKRAAKALVDWAGEDAEVAA